jgi:mannobiose 2-epimerase
MNRIDDPQGAARRRACRGMACAMLLLAAGCDVRPQPAARVDATWHRQDLMHGLLDHWGSVAPTASGFMRSAVDRRWVAAAPQPGQLTDQARLVYAFAVGFEFSKDPRHLEAATRGTEFLLQRFRDPVHGGFFLAVAEDGTVVRDAKRSYGHAFALLALSHMTRVTGETRYREAALKTWKEIDTGLRDPAGGFRAELPRNFSQAGQAGALGTQNPIMHLFEALLALHEATQDPAALAGAKGVVDFVVYRLLVGTADGGAYIPEWYGADWKPLASREQGGYTDIGHQFEWIHMLRTAEQRGLVGVYGPIADRLLKYAVGKGYDDIEGGVFTTIYPDGTLARDKNYWQQCEAMRAFLSLAAGGSDEAEAWRRYEQTLGLVRSQFIDTRNGGWFPKACKAGGCIDAQVEPYHMVGLHRAALTMADAGAK